MKTAHHTIHLSPPLRAERRITFKGIAPKKGHETLRAFYTDGGTIAVDQIHEDGSLTVHVIGAAVSCVVIAYSHIKHAPADKEPS